MSLTTHDPSEPCVGHCMACGAYHDWSERIVGLLALLERARDILGPESGLYFEFDEAIETKGASHA